MTIIMRAPVVADTGVIQPGRRFFQVRNGLGSPTYDLAKRVVDALALNDFWSAVAIMGELSPADLAAVVDKSIALGADPDAVRSVAAMLGKTEVIEVVGTAPKAPARPWWLYAVGAAGLLGIGLITYKALRK